MLGKVWWVGFLVIVGIYIFETNISVGVLYKGLLIKNIYMNELLYRLKGDVKET